MFIIVLAVLVALGIGIGTGFFFRASILGRRMKDAGEEASRILEEAEEQRKRALLEAKEEALGVRTAAESDLRERRSELQNQERRLANREENIERRSDNLDKREKSQVGREKELEEGHVQLEAMKHQELEVLENLSSLSANDARDLLMKKAEDEIQYEVARRYRDVEQLAREEADQTARKVLILCIHLLASAVVS